jgi:small multidrug resistance pump
MHWLLLAAAVGFEVVGTTSMKLSAGFTKLVPSIAVFVCYAVAMTCCTLALKRLDLSVAYTIWAGAGTAITAVIGIVVFREPVTALKLAALGLTITGIVCLQLSAR